jgi:ribosomal protein S18 acetylase RimI-like enzyme
VDAPARSTFFVTRFRIPDVSEQDVIIRLHEPRDRAAVREICCDTADAGEPCESFFPDREVLADLVTRYYTDFAPQSSWVAEQNGTVTGYLSGSLDTRKAMRATLWRIVPVTFLKAAGRGLFWHRQFRQLVSVNCREWMRTGIRRPVSLDEYPAHLHINLRKEARGRRIGERLVERFFEQMRAAGVTGVHVGVSEANDGGRKFFERLGFVELGRAGRFRHPATPERLIQTILYGKHV